MSGPLPLTRGEEGSMGPWCSRMTAAGWVVMVVTLALVIGLTVWTVCRLFPTPAPRIPDPHATLDARLAAGDIDLNTYVQLRQQLDSAATSPAAGVTARVGAVPNPPRRKPA